MECQIPLLCSEFLSIMLVEEPHNELTMFTQLLVWSTWSRTSISVQTWLRQKPTITRCWQASTDLGSDPGRLMRAKRQIVDRSLLEE